MTIQVTSALNTHSEPQKVRSAATDPSRFPRDGCRMVMTIAPPAIFVGSGGSGKVSTWPFDAFYV